MLSYARLMYVCVHMQDEFGSRVIQEVLVHAPSFAHRVKFALREQFQRLSLQQYSSAIVETVIRHSLSFWRHTTISEVSAESGVADLVRSQYGMTTSFRWLCM